MDRSIMVPEPYRANGDLLHRSHQLAGVDIFSDAEGILCQKENA